MTKQSRYRIERILRRARQQVGAAFPDDNEKVDSTIKRCKSLLKPLWKEEHDQYMTYKLEKWLAIQ
jgi:hypothetical protein